MSESILWTLVVFVYVLTVALAPVLALAIVLLSRRRSTTTALGSIVGAVAGIVTLGATVGFALVSWQAGAVLFLAGQGALLALGVVPLLVGRGIVRQATGVDREPALRIAVTAWPVSLAGGFALFVTPGGFAGEFAHSNITTLSGATAALAWTGWAVLVLLGPGVLGSVGVRIGQRFR
jgi:hypothetical protein